MSKAERDPYKVACGRRLYRARTAVGYGDRKRRKFAELTGEREANLEKWENGDVLVPPAYVDKLRRLFGIRHDYIFNGDPSGMPHDLAIKIIQAEEE